MRVIGDHEFSDKTNNKHEQCKSHMYSFSLYVNNVFIYVKLN